MREYLYFHHPFTLTHTCIKTTLAFKHNKTEEIKIKLLYVLCAERYCLPLLAFYALRLGNLSYMWAMLLPQVDFVSRKRL